MSGELKKVSKEAVSAKFGLLSQHLPGLTEQNLEEPQPG
jgi:hypothetical protein